MNPSFADAYYGLSWALVCAGRPAESIAAIDNALRLSPHDPYIPSFLPIRCAALMLEGRYDEGMDSANAAARHPNAKLTAFLAQATCLVILGKVNEARIAFDKVLQFKPDLTVASLRRLMPFQPSDFDKLFEGLWEHGLLERDTP